MQNLLSELYQVLGGLNAPENVMDQVLAASLGEPLPHETLLPFVAPTSDSEMQAPKRQASQLEYPKILEDV